MYWVKTQSGGLVNLANATDVKVVQHRDPERKDYRVEVFFISGGEAADYTPIFTGSKVDCEAYLARLAEKLVPQAEPSSSPDDAIPF